MDARPDKHANIMINEEKIKRIQQSESFKGGNHIKGVII